MTEGYDISWQVVAALKDCLATQPESTLCGMSYLFRVEKRTGSDESILGYEWVEVLAIEPWALGHPTKEFGDWCAATVSVMYVCMTPSGLTRIGSEDFWHAVEDLREYDDETATSGLGAAITVTAGSQSIVQVASTSKEKLSTGDSYTAGAVGAMGPNASTRFKGNFVTLLDGESPESLVNELGRLRQSFRESDPTPENDVVLGALAEAELSAAQEDGPNTRSALRRAGHRSLEIAKEIGVEVAAAAIAKSLGV
jgi:hypothetical protein